MSTHFSPAEMDRRIVRLRELEPTKRSYEGSGTGIPSAAYEMLAARNIYMLMAPKNRSRGMNKPAVEGLPGLEVAIVECPPGNGAELHVHERTTESFMPLDGRYEVIWGDKGEQTIVLEPYDFVSVPPGVYRSFRNVDDHETKMLVFIQGPEGDSMNDITYETSVGQRIEARFGPEATANMANIGIRFAPESSPL
ncbi:cupin domain-containing protein [Variovorax paradoxus]|nr:cupin domain-containing protein [Variovorax paradoxus]